MAQGQIAGVSSMEAGDLDGDGLADVVVIEGGKHADGRKTFSWFKAPAQLQDAWQRFEINPDVLLRAFLGSAKLADLDLDGDLDLVVSSDNHSGEQQQADVWVFMNPRPERQATESWSGHRVNDSVLALHHINDMEIADMDADGRPDIVVRSLEPNQIHIFFQDSLWAYTLKSIDTQIENAEGLAVGYLDDDPYPDLTYTGYWLQSSDPRREAYTRRPIEAGYHQINQNTKEAVGDLDGDGRPDVVIGPAEAYRNGGSYDLAWYRNPGGGGYDSDWSKTVIQAGVNDHHTVKLGDMNRDGALDVVVGIPWGERRIQIYYNDGAGGFSEAQTVVQGKGLYSGVVQDLDNDGDLDIVGQDTYAQRSRPWVYENQYEE